MLCPQLMTVSLNYFMTIQSPNINSKDKVIKHFPNSYVKFHDTFPTGVVVMASDLQRSDFDRVGSNLNSDVFFVPYLLTRMLHCGYVGMVFSFCFLCMFC